MNVINHYIMWLKQCHDPPMTGTGKHTTYKNTVMAGDGVWHCYNHIEWNSSWFFAAQAWRIQRAQQVLHEVRSLALAVDVTQQVASAQTRWGPMGFSLGYATFIGNTQKKLCHHVPKKCLTRFGCWNLHHTHRCRFSADFGPSFGQQIQMLQPKTHMFCAYLSFQTWAANMENPRLSG